MLKKVKAQIWIGASRLIKEANLRRGTEKRPAAVSGGENKYALTGARGADVTSLDPHIGKETPAVMATNQIFDTLFTTDDEGKIVGQIAESWKYLSDTELEVHVRSGIKFHDGSPLSASDVKFSLDRAIASTAVSYIVNFIKEVRVVDDHTVVIETAKPYAAALRNLAHPSSVHPPGGHCAAVAAAVSTLSQPEGTVTAAVSGAVRAAGAVGPMVRATSRTYLRSALPSSSGGVPTALKTISTWSSTSVKSVVKWSRPTS